MLRIVGAGLGRNASTSTAEALEFLLKGPCYHMDKLLTHPQDVAVWIAALEGRAPVWDDFLKDYRAAVDGPAAFFWRELSEAFPDAHILLATRDPQKWLQSARSTIFTEVFVEPYNPLMREWQR